MKRKKVYKESVTNTIDTADGTLIAQTTQQITFVEREPDYVKLYITDIMKLNNLPKSCNSLLMELLRKANYSNEIIIVKSIRLEICKRLDIAEITFRKGMELFIDKGILTRKDKNVFIANPFLFGRGSWDNIKNIRLMVNYNEQGRFIMKEESQPRLEFPGERPSISGVRFDDKIDNKETKIYLQGWNNLK